MATVAGNNGAPPPPPGDGNGGKRGPTDIDDGGGGKRAALGSAQKGPRRQSSEKGRRRRKDLVLKHLVIKRNEKNDSIIIHGKTQAARGAIAMRTINKSFKDTDDKTGQVSVNADVMKILEQTDIGVYVEADVEWENMTAKQQEEETKAAEEKNRVFNLVKDSIPASAMLFLQEAIHNAPQNVKDAFEGVRVLEKPKTPEQVDLAAGSDTSSDSDFSEE